jgi:hypothetical protein
VLKGEINMTDALRKRRNSGISRGTHYRIIAQAKKNIVKSLLTVSTGVQMGLLNPEDVQKLISAVSVIPVDADSQTSPEVIALVTLLAQRIVML